MQIHTLRKNEVEAVLPHLFTILYTNMNPIAPSVEPFEETRAGWVEVIGNALKDPRRTMLIVRNGEEIVGFFMYACNGENFLMEEIQLIPRVQGSETFRAIYDEVFPRLPETVQTVEAYAHKKNLRSQGILEHLGLTVIGENKSGNSYRYRGDYDCFKRRFAFT